MQFITSISFNGRNNGTLYNGMLAVETCEETNQVLCTAELHYKQWSISRMVSVYGEEPNATTSAALLALDECADQLWEDMPRGWTVKTRAIGEELASVLCEELVKAVMADELPAACVKGNNLTSALLTLGANRAARAR